MRNKKLTLFFLCTFMGVILWGTHGQSTPPPLPSFDGSDSSCMDAENGLGAVWDYGDDGEGGLSGEIRYYYYNEGTGEWVENSKSSGHNEDDVRAQLHCPDASAQP